MKPINKERINMASNILASSIETNNIHSQTLCEYTEDMLPKIYFAIAKAEQKIEQDKKNQQELWEKSFVAKIYEKYPQEVNDKKQQLNGLISLYGACHIVAKEKGEV